MNAEIFRDYCLTKKGISECFPFDEETLVFKVMGKMFAYVSLENASANLKCHPEKAVALREEYNWILPGYHMNKNHWNTILFHPACNDELIKVMIDHSYDLVVSGLTRRQKQELNQLKFNFTRS